jgi:nucleotide-binding universal stress UspA family protein
MKKILVAVDGSPVQTRLVETAVELAQATSSRLVLYRSVGAPLELPPNALSVSPDELPQILMRRAESNLEELSKKVPAALREGVRVEIGSAWRGVVEAAEREHAELIVIGSHGYGGIDRLLGTTAAKIVDHAKCSVLVVRG